MLIAHVTTVDSSLRFLLLPQLLAAVSQGDQAIGISAPGPFVAELAAAGIGHRPLPSSTRGMDLRADARAAWELWRILRREDVDVVHTHNPKPGLYGRVVARLAGVPIVVHTTHGLYATEEDRRLKRGLVYLAEAVASRFSHAELVQNPEDLALMTRLHLVPRHAATLLGNGVDLGRFDPDRFDLSARIEGRRALGVGVDQVAVGTVGRLVREKGYRELLAAAAQLGDGYRLIVIGPEDPEKADALDPHEVARAEASGVRFLGMRRDIDALYAAMDVFVLASHREGFPRAAMEAAAMGLPVVATDIRGCRQVVRHGLTGLLVPPRDPAALAEGIRRLGEDPELRRRMGVAGRELARQDFDERRVVATVMDTYRQVAARQGRHSPATPPPSLSP